MSIAHITLHFTLTAVTARQFPQQEKLRSTGRGGSPHHSAMVVRISSPLRWMLMRQTRALLDMAFSSPRAFSIFSPLISTTMSPGWMPMRRAFE